MLIGIDVGGTFTDGVLFNGELVTKSVKHPTDNCDLKGTLLSVLDELLRETDHQKIRRIVFSTTLVTNIIATGSGDKTALILLPGPGMPYSAYDLFPYTFFIRGSVDFRGRILEFIDPHEVVKVADAVNEAGIKQVAVVGKFSNRNNQLENEVRKILLDRYPHMVIATGSEMAGQLNFRRRLVTTYYSVITQAAWNTFTKEIEEALAARQIEADVQILKADGGTIPIKLSRSKPCETVFSGPAASAMGAVALTMNPRNAVVLDIGGTTTDISLLIEGNPLYASKGANIDGHYTHINAFSVRSLALGGDSPVLFKDEKVALGIQRRGPAACFGGPVPTVIDAFNYKYDLKIGNPDESLQHLEKLALEAGIKLDNLCAQVESLVAERLQQAIRKIFSEWENEPAYRVWEVVHSRKFLADEIIGIGAAAGVIVPILAKQMGIDFFLHPYSPVANALGACLARPTLSFQLHIDTEKQSFFLDQEGIRGKVTGGRSFQMKDAKELAWRYLQDIAKNQEMSRYSSQAEFFLEEQFNVIRGWTTAGKIFEIGIQVRPGLIEEYKGVSI